MVPRTKISRRLGPHAVIDGVEVRVPPREPQLDQPATVVEVASDVNPSSLGDSDSELVIVPAGISVHSLSSIVIIVLELESMLDK